MGVMKFLENVLNKVEEYGPQAMDYMQKAQDKVERQNEQKREEIERYQREYTHLEDRELVDELNRQKSFPTKRAAIAMLLKERGYILDSDNVWRKK